MKPVNKTSNTRRNHNVISYNNSRANEEVSFSIWVNSSGKQDAFVSHKHSYMTFCVEFKAKAHGPVLKEPGSGDVARH